MRRKRNAGGDSLELFLDTICNTFGGVIFLAILVAILSQTKGMIQDNATEGVTSLTPSQVRELKQRLTTAEAQFENLERAIATLSEEAISQESLEYLTIRDEQIKLQKKITSVNAELPGLDKTIDQLNRTNAEIEAELQQVPKDLVAIRDKVEDKLGEISDVIQQKQTMLKLPRVTKVNQTPSLVLLKHGKVYWAGEFRSRRGSFDGPQHVTVKKGLLGGYDVIPVVGGGIAGDGSEFEKLANETKARGNVVQLATWRDSFGTFQQVKPILIEAGVKYDTWVMNVETLNVNISSISSIDVQ